MKVADPKTTASRAFVRSLNILLKFARLYGYEHTRTIEHLDTAWRELRAAIPRGHRRRLAARRHRESTCYWMEYRSKAPRRKAIRAASFRCRPRQRAVLSVRHRRGIGPLCARISHRQSETRGVSRAAEVCAGGRSRHSHQRDLLCGHGLALPGRQRGGATRGLDDGRRSGSIQAVAERPPEAAGDDCGGARCDREGSAVELADRATARIWRWRRRRGRGRRRTREGTGGAGAEEPVAEVAPVSTIASQEAK